MNKRTITLVTFLLVGIATIIGCGENGENTREDSKEPSTTQNSADAEYPKLTRTWVGSNGQDEANSVGPVLGSVESLQFIDDYFRALEWSKPEIKPVIAIELNDAESLEIRLSPDATTDRPEYVAVWTRPGPMIAGATSAEMKQSPRLNSSEQATGLLRSFVTEKGDVATLLDWKD